MKKAALLILALALMVTGFACTGNKGPAPASSNSNLSISGGNSASGSGGGNGYLEMYTYSAPIAVNSTGSVDASFTIPPFNVNYGLNKYEVSANQTVQLDQNNTAGALFMLSNGTSYDLFVGDGSGTASISNGTAVTGLVVDSGVTLTLPGNYYGDAEAYVNGDITINGIVNSTSTSYFEIWTDNGGMTIGSTGKVDATHAGGNGTDTYLYGLYMINQGTVTAKGDAGYNGGYVDLESEFGTVNTGVIDGSGGDNATGAGGNANWVEVESDNGNAANSGSMLAKGGVGGNGNGGSGSDVYLYGCDSSNNYYGSNGDVLVSGTLDASGGSATNGNGGDGSEVYLETDAFGAVKVNATINANGGSGNTATYGGGSAGNMEIDSYTGSVDVPNPGAIQIAGTISLNGGSGDAYGGSADGLYVYGDVDYNYEGVGPAVQLFGFGPVMMNGGDGATSGGYGDDYVDLYSYSGQVYATSQYLPGGAITFQPDLYMRGGNVTNDTKGSGHSGGAGGYVYIYPGYDGNYNSNTNATVGNMYLTGGTGDIGGYGGYADMEEATTVTTGNIIADGGAGLTTGGSADEISLYSNLLNTTHGTLSAAGGTGGTTAGTKGSIYIDGVQIQ